MTSLKPLQLAGFILGAALLLYFVYSHLQSFSSISFLGLIFLAEVIIASLWKYSQRFFPLLMISFLWAGMHVPLQDAWTSGRWLVLAIGALVGFLSWMKGSRAQFKTFHLLAMFCLGAAFVSATVSPFVQMASFKALSLTLLFIYCSSGARRAVLGREEKFFNGLVWGCEILVYASAICYSGIGPNIWGNPNSLGAVMSIGVFPILLWGWLTANGRATKVRRLTALLLCSCLIFYSMARAGMVSMALEATIFCVCLHQYRLLVKVVGVVLLLVAAVGMFAPATLNREIETMTDAVLYKGHQSEGLLGSRQTPWQKTVASIKEHPWFGTGYGTSPSGEDPGLNFGRFSSTAETAREHGSSYMTITEWVGILGVTPFFAILILTALNVWRVCAWMNRTSNPYHYSIPLAMVVLSGLLHASFEDWLFAAGSYPCVFFWFCAFILADLKPAAAAHAPSPVPIFAGHSSVPVPNYSVPVPSR